MGKVFDAISKVMEEKKSGRTAVADHTPSASPPAEAEGRVLPAEDALFSEPESLDTTLINDEELPTRPTAFSRPGPGSNAAGKRPGGARSGMNLDEKLIAITQSASPMAESFRRLRSLILHPPPEKSFRTIMVASSIPQEGKSFVCANLGAITAQAVNGQVLLIDCDMRRPSLAGIFGINNDRGLGDLLQGKGDLAGLVQPSGFQNLAILPCGPPPINPAELFASDRMPALLNELVAKHGVRYVFLDSPPCSVASETAVLARYVDGLILVVRAGRAGREQVKSFAESLGREKILGVVFNAFESNPLEKKLFGDYYGYHQHYYSTGYGEKK